MSDLFVLKITTVMSREKSGKLHLRVLIPHINITHTDKRFAPKPTFLCFVDRASLYNLVNKTNLVHSLFLVYLSISTCFGRLWAHHQEKQLCFYDTLSGWNLSFHPAYQTVAKTQLFLLMMGP